MADQEPRALQNSLVPEDDADRGEAAQVQQDTAAIKASDNPCITFFSPESDSPGGLSHAKTPTQSVVPISRDDSTSLH